MTAADRSSTRIFICHRGFVITYLALEKPVTYIDSSGWPTPYVALVRGELNGANALTSGNFTGSDAYTKSVVTGGDILFYLVRSSRLTTSINDYLTRNPYTGRWAVYPTALFSITSGLVGHYGAINDMWLVGSTTVQSGECHPAAGSRQFAVLGHYLFPWNGSPCYAS
jgi:hypothetical protein